MPRALLCASDPGARVRRLTHRTRTAVNDIGCTPLHVAADVGDLHVCRLLLDYSADPTLANEDGDVPADVATETDVVEALAAAMPEAARSAWEQRRTAVFEQPPGLDDDDDDDDDSGSGHNGYGTRVPHSNRSYDDGDDDGERRAPDALAVRWRRWWDGPARSAWSPVLTWVTICVGASALVALWVRTRR
jgi:hypothetical protein